MNDESDDAPVRTVTVDPADHVGLLVLVINAMRIQSFIDKRDLVQEGYLYLHGAAQRFDVTKGFQFTTFAGASIHRGVIRSINAARCVGHVPHNVLNAFRSVERNHPDARPSEVESLIDASVSQRGSTAANSQNERWDALAYYTWKLGERSLDDLAWANSGDSLGSLATLGDTIPSAAPSAFDLLDDEQRREFVWRLLAETRLSLREREIIEARFLRDEPETLLELGERYGLSRERIRQLEALALAKLRVTAERLLLTE